MPRPCKRRRVCMLPRCERFGPLNGNADGALVMTVEECESIRLIDLESLTQEECADRMGVARTTAQSVYLSARRKLADALVHGRELRIEGGDYALCDGTNETCACGLRCARKQQDRSDIPMKIAVTYENGQVFQHFGHTAQFLICTVENGAITAKQIVDTNGSGHGALGGFLREQGVDTLICGGIGGGAQQALTAAGIRWYGGVQGDAEAAVNALLADRLTYDPAARCTHHDHEHAEGHVCGSHGCGGH